MSGTVTNRTCKYGTSKGNYINSVSNPSNTGCNITGLAENTTYYYQVCGSNSGGQNCNIGNIETGIRLSSVVEIGDYVVMVPTATSYNIPTSVTGDGNSQTINLRTLNLWRIIKKNADGTVEMVSNDVLSTRVSFYGLTGYANLVGGLNSISVQFTDGKNVLRTRHMGYSNQTEKCSAYNLSDCETDTGYKTDLELVNVAYGGSPSCVSNCAGLIAHQAGTDVGGLYWLASRYRDGSYYGRYVNGKGTLVKGVLSVNELSEYRRIYSVRPIVTLKSDTEISSGSGTESSPYKLGNS